MIEVVRAGLMDLVVDGVPRRALRFGLSEAGPADAPSLWAANRRVGNPSWAAGLEILAQGPVLATRAPLVACVCGGALEPTVDGTPAPWGEAFEVPAGATLAFRRARPGLRAYLAVGGGIDVPAAFGSRSADLPSQLPGLAGRALRAGDVLPVGPVRGEARASGPPPPATPPVGEDGAALLRVLPGPQWHMAPTAVRRHLLGARLRVTPQASRVGLVLEGEGEAPRWAAADMPSEGTLAGSVQWTPAGRPVLLLVDRGSLGGYPKPLQVIAADAWRAAQLRPGEAVRFVPVTRAAARAALAEVCREAEA
ncbi:MAG: biotin-dependent carboxyltransferase family protein [Firmicutes bacterium]|nr:biotin-dependent carboxyltransferase family protein [Bacillota bacterium]